jgi:hypothetical protein
MNSTWQALAREAGLAAEHIAVGATALGRANYAQEAYYAQAFFALSVGFERASKLAIAVDYAITEGGAYPAPGALRHAGHDLAKLLDDADRIAGRRGLSSTDRLPRTDIHGAIVSTLSEFANNVTRYFNLDLVTQDPRIVGHEDPVAAWSQRVTKRVLAKHYRPHLREQHETQARQIEVLLADVTRVRFHAETGEPITDVYDGSRRSAAARIARPWERMYVLQIARFLGKLLGHLGYLAHTEGLEDIPYFSEFFAIFNNRDSYLRRRKTWSIH